MPTTKSAKKRLRQGEARRLRNRATKSNLKTVIRKTREATESGAPDQADAIYRAAAKQLDRAAARGVIHANKAARVKSRLQHQMKAQKAAK